MRVLRQFGALTVGLLALASVAPAYYHWTYFTQRTGAFTALRLRFDVNALPNQTVSFFIAKQGPAKLVAGDSFSSLASQIRRAGETWNVENAALKVRFGGYQEKAFSDVLTEQVTPGIDVVFDDDLPPGVLALSEPLTYTDLKYLGDKNSPGFAPILRSRLQLASDLAARGQASYSDAFFATLVHEFGHTLGLQHSMTGGAMSTSIIRGTSKANPLTADDVAGLSVLYPTPEFRAYTGSLTGKVTVAGVGANLASVVALSADGTAVGSMTLPDGTYRIEGLPPGDYRVYAHPLPPAQEGEANPAGIVPPQDLEHAPFLAAAPFETRFYPGTKDWTQATLAHVDAGRTVSGADFGLQPISGNGIYNLRVFAYLGANRDKIVHAAPLPTGFRDWLAVQATGIVNAGKMAPGLAFSVIGDAAKLEQGTLRNFPGSDQFLLIVGDALAVDHTTPVAVVMSTDTDLYVLPNAFTVVPSKHPALKSLDSYTDSQGRPHAVIDVSNATIGTRVLFDGAEALSKLVRNDGLWDIEAPPGNGGKTAFVELLGVDGQSSAQLLGDAVLPQFNYPAQSDASETLTPGELMAGADGLIAIDGAFSDFLDDLTKVGFGSSDITVRDLWVVNRNQLMANVSVSAQAKLGAVSPTIATGLQVVSAGPQLQIRPRDPKQVVLFSTILNEATGLGAAPAGATVLLSASGLPEDLTGWSVSVSDQLAPLTRLPDGRLRAVVPVTVAVGPNRVRFVGPNGASSNVVMFRVESQPPVITAVVNTSSVGLSALQSVLPGDRVRLTVSHLVDEGIVPGKADVTLRIGGLKQKADLVDDATQPNMWVVEFVVPPTAAVGDAQPLTVGVGTRVSAPWKIPVAASTAKDEVPVE